jgi:hypothetical protein
VAGMISALVSAGVDGGYLVNPRLAKVHWQALDRALPAPASTRSCVGAVDAEGPTNVMAGLRSLVWAVAFGPGARSRLPRGCRCWRR